MNKPNRIEEGWLFFLKDGKIDSVKLPQYGKVVLSVTDGNIVFAETRTQEKL
ncbi:hypothetical protein JEQ21_02945 [Streptococcus sp. 121]|uniref:hypothetical protein n=1 Tax=Streptococcus sp. 121 TaxID=2797637 RepID=UPI0018F0BBB8|nr:hypothetical protein [Streptococcus sp. 121]MBJ6745430.1 hypothetical protein [Streptococcus sp. 121]